MIVAKAFLQPEVLDKSIEQVKPLLQPDVVSLGYRLGEDWTGDPAIFFQVVLTDNATRRERLLPSAKHAQQVIEEHVQPWEQWGVWPYFNFRSQAEQAIRGDKGW